MPTPPITEEGLLVTPAPSEHVGATGFLWNPVDATSKGQAADGTPLLQPVIVGRGAVETGASGQVI